MALPSPTPEAVANPAPAAPAVADRASAAAEVHCKEAVTVLAAVDPPAAFSLTAAETPAGAQTPPRHAPGNKACTAQGAQPPSLR